MIAMKGRVSPLNLAREGNPLAGRFPRGREEKTIPELVPKPLARIRDRGAPLIAQASAAGIIGGMGVEPRVPSSPDGGTFCILWRDER